MDKPKEFWIGSRAHSAHIGRVDTKRHTAWGNPKVSTHCETFIHVIEKSAADKLAHFVENEIKILSLAGVKGPAAALSVALAEYREGK